MQLFYNPEITSTTKEIIFSKEESRHIIKVLRKKEQDLLYITNGLGILFTAKINAPSDKKCVATVIDFEHRQKEWNYYLHVAIAPTKNNDRLEWFLEKATEIGIDEITPIICQNSERRSVKKERLEKIILSAMKQSLKYTLPKLNDPIKFTDFISQEPSEGLRCIAHCEDSDKTSFKSVLKNDSKVMILIGPEGDFSINEIKLALTKGITPISLGNSRLRTETAGLAAVHSVSFLNQ